MTKIEQKEKEYLELYNLKYNSALYMCRSYLKNEEDALDVLQHSFLKVWEKWDSYREDMGTKRTTWFYAIVRNNCLNAIQAKQTRYKHISSIEDETFLENISLQSNEKDQLDFLREKEVEDALLKAIKGLKYSRRNLIISSILKNEDMNMIHKKMGKSISKKTLYTRKAKIMQILKKNKNLKTVLLGE